MTDHEQATWGNAHPDEVARQEKMRRDLKRIDAAFTSLIVLVVIVGIWWVLHV